MRGFSSLFRSALAVLVLAGTPAPAAAQSYFNTRYPLAAGFSAFSSLVPRGTGYVTAGETIASPQSLRRLTLAFCAADGHQQLVRSYGWPNASLYAGVSGSLLPQASGGYALIGGRDPSLAMLWRFDAQGDTLWTRTYAAPTEHITLTGCLLADSGFALAGTHQRVAGRTAADVLVIRTDALGHVRWQRTYPIFDWATALGTLATADGGVLVTGHAAVDLSAIVLNADGFVLKLDSAGNVEWQRTFGRRFKDGAGPAVQTPDGGYLIGGWWSDTTITISYSQARPLLLKLDAQGNEQWRRLYGPARYNTESCRLHALADGSYLLAGQMGDPNETPVQGYTSPVGFLLNVCPEGDSLWLRTYRLLTGGSSKNYLRDVIPTADGGFAGAGFVHVRPPDTGTPDAWLFKVDRYGRAAPGPAPVLVCNGQPLGVAGEGRGEPFGLYPNPSAGVVHVRGGAGAGSARQLRVYDALGRLVRQAALAGGEEAEVRLTLPPGLYHCQLVADGNVVATERLMVGE